MIAQAACRRPAFRDLLRGTYWPPKESHPRARRLATTCTVATTPAKALCVPCRRATSLPRHDRSLKVNSKTGMFVDVTIDAAASTRSTWKRVYRCRTRHRHGEGDTGAAALMPDPENNDPACRQCCGLRRLSCRCCSTSIRFVLRAEGQIELREKGLTVAETRRRASRLTASSPQPACAMRCRR